MISAGDLIFHFKEGGVTMPTEILQELREIKQLLALNKKMWTLEDFCVFTGLSKQYAYHLTSSGKVKFYRPFGKVIYFDAEEVIEFLKQNQSADSQRLKSKLDAYFLNH
jgi:excisionase family DNA binding protein